MIQHVVYVDILVARRILKLYSGVAINGLFIFKQLYSDKGGSIQIADTAHALAMAYAGVGDVHAESELMNKYSTLA